MATSMNVTTGTEPRSKLMLHNFLQQYKYSTTLSIYARSITYLVGDVNQSCSTDQSFLKVV